jgi:hypothetical protein
VPLTAAARARYPADWGLLSWTVLHRAGMRCECTGECGRPHDHLDPADGRCRNRHGEPRWRGRRYQRPVVLSAAHLDHDPAGSDLARIAAYCEGCHLCYDRTHHAVTRRLRREQQLGLIGLFELEAAGSV